MSLKRTPLYDRHVALGARMVPFGGWEMPVQYAGIVAEHKACRAGLGLFDVSHMGEFRISGPGAVAFLESALTNSVADLALGRCRYSLLCHHDGGILDDLIFCREADDSFLLVVNAGNIEADREWLTSLPAADCVLTDLSDRTALLAIQGPRSGELLGDLLGADADRLASLKYYRFAEFNLFGLPVVISRTGYTGDLGYELMLPAEHAVTVWDGLRQAGQGCGLEPIGLGARDTLRLEAGFCLHGHDISPERNPLEAGLGRFVKFDKGDFVGRDALLRVQADGPAEQLIGLVVTGRGVIRQDYPIRQAGESVGVVTSGSFAPSLERFIGLGYVRSDLAADGTRLEVDVRGKEVGCVVVPRPFYQPD